MNRLSLSICFICLFNLTLNAQEEKNNFYESWTSVSIQYKLNKKLSFELEEQVRFAAQPFEFDRFFTELTTSYKLNKKFRTAIGLRHLGINDHTGKQQGYEDHFRFHIDLGHKCKPGRFLLKQRLRYQHRNELGVTQEEFDFPAQDLRYKVFLKYNIKGSKIDPYIYKERFYHRELRELDGPTKKRYGIGAAYNMKNGHEVKLTFIYEKETLIWNPERFFVFKLSYTYSLKRKGI